MLESQVAVFLLVVQRKIELSSQYFARKSRPCDITKKTVPLNPSNAEKSLAMVDGVLDSVFCILDDFLGISKPFFCLASDLFMDALGFLLLV